MTTKFRKSGLRAISTLLEKRVSQTTQKRGFAVSRLVTNWSEIVGTDTAAMCLPLKVTYPKEGFGSTLSLLVKSAHAPMLQMQIPKLIEQINACYGYRAITDIKLTQTAPTGFAEGRAQFDPAPTPMETQQARQAKAAAQQAAASLATQVNNEGLRAAIERLGTNVLSRKY